MAKKKPIQQIIENDIDKEISENLKLYSRFFDRGRQVEREESKAEIEQLRIKAESKATKIIDDARKQANSEATQIIGRAQEDAKQTREEIRAEKKRQEDERKRIKNNSWIAFGVSSLVFFASCLFLHETENPLFALLFILLGLFTACLIGVFLSMAVGKWMVGLVATPFLLAVFLANGSILPEQLAEAIIKKFFS